MAARNTPPSGDIAKQALQLAGITAQGVPERNWFTTWLCQDADNKAREHRTQELKTKYDSAVRTIELTYENGWRQHEHEQEIIKMQLAERKRQDELDEQKRKDELAEKIRQGELAEKKRQEEVQSKMKREDIEEKKRQEEVEKNRWMADLEERKRQEERDDKLRREANERDDKLRAEDREDEIRREESRARRIIDGFAMGRDVGEICDSNYNQLFSKSLPSRRPLTLQSSQLRTFDGPERDEQTSSPISESVKILRKARRQLLEGINGEAVETIVDELMAARDGQGILTMKELDAIRGRTTVKDKARCLLDAISDHGDCAIDVLALALESPEIDRPHLASLLRDRLPEQIQ